LIPLVYFSLAGIVGAARLAVMTITALLQSLYHPHLADCHGIMDAVRACVCSFLLSSIFRRPAALAVIIPAAFNQGPHPSINCGRIRLIFQLVFSLSG